MPVDVRVNKRYRVRNRDVFLSLTIGEGQHGTSDVFLDDKRLLRASGTIGKLLLGHGPDLVGRILTVRSVVNDVSTTTNRMSVTCRLNGGESAEEFVAKGKVEESGAPLVFEVHISLR
jgi:hypothetical protein